MTATSVQSYLDDLNSYSQSNPRYQWLLSYLRQDPQFFNERIYPVMHGRARTIVADFYNDETMPASIQHPRDGEELAKILSSRLPSIKVRLILVVGISGLDEHILQQRVMATSMASGSSREQIAPDLLAPVLTRPRTAGVTGFHPIKDHISCLSEPETLSCVAAATQLDVGVLLRHLDQREHLAHKSQSQSLLLSRQQRASKVSQGQPKWLDISVGVNQENYMTAVIISGTMASREESSSRSSNDVIHQTVCLLVNEDNCLGIDFNTLAGPEDQVLPAPGKVPHELFEAAIRSKSDTDRRLVLEEPLCLVWDYTAGMCSAFAAQLELYRRKWEVLYAPYANTSAVYGNATSRTHVRKEASELASHLRYMERSVQSLKQIAREKERDLVSPGFCKSALDALVQDFEEMSSQLERLRSAYDNFIEQQVSKISLHEARKSMTEARDLQRLSYLGFVFAPLSLASSFFSIQIRPLGGEAPVWAFVVTSLGILGFSLLVLLLLNHKIRKPLRLAIEHVNSFFSSVFERELYQDLPTYEKQKPVAGSSLLADSSGANINKGSQRNTDHNLPPSRNLDEQLAAQCGRASQGSSDAITKQTMDKNQHSRANSSATQLSAVSRTQRPKAPQNDAQRNRNKLTELKDSLDHEPPEREEFADKPRNTTPLFIRSTYGQIHTKRTLPPVAESREPMSSVVSTDNKSDIQLDTSNQGHDAGRDQHDQPTNSEASNTRSDTDDAVKGRHEEGVSTNENQDDGAEVHDVAESSNKLVFARSDVDNDDDSNDDEDSHESTSPVSREAVYEKVDFARIDLAITDVPTHLVQYDGIDDRSSWPPDSEDILMVIAISKLCRERDKRGISVFVSAKKQPDQSFDGLYAWALTEAARYSFLEALPLFYNLIKHPDTVTDSLSWALRKAIGDSDEHLATMRWLKGKGAPINIKREAENNILTIASRGGHAKALRLLLDWGADLKEASARTSRQTTPLQEATRGGHLEVTKILLEAGAPTTDSTAVRNAVSAGHLDILKALVTAGAKLFGPGSDLDWRSDPLCLAAQGGHHEVVSYILELGAPLDEPLGNQWVRGYCAFVDAARSGGPSSEAICLMFLDLGVKTKFTTLGRSFLSKASRSIADDLYMFAALSGKTNFLARVLKTGADPNAISRLVGNLYMEFLLPRMPEVANGAKIEEVNGYSMLAIACGAGRFEAASLLLFHGADVHFAGDRPPPVKTTPLHIAADNGRFDICELLLSRRADIDARKSPGGATPLQLAACEGYSACVKVLLGHGAALEAGDDEGQTALILAARNGKLDTVELLLDEGASVSARDQEGWTAAHRAAWNGHERVLKLLSERGADMEAETDSGLKIEELLRDAKEDLDDGWNDGLI